MKKNVMKRIIFGLKILLFSLSWIPITIFINIILVCQYGELTHEQMFATLIGGFFINWLAMVRRLFNCELELYKNRKQLNNDKNWKG